METIELISNIKIGDDLHHLIFRKNEMLSLSYQIPGQYISLENDSGERSYYAFASAPSDPTVDFLVKEQARGMGYSLSYFEKGQEVVVTDTMGKGFPISKAEGKDLHLFSMGSGLAPFRSLIREHIAKKAHQFRSIHLWQGSESEVKLPFIREYELWEKNNIIIHRCLSREKENMNICKTLESTKIKFSKAVGFWIGSKEFNQNLRSVLEEKKFPLENMFSNY